VSQERGKILIVDDDDDMVAMLETVLGVDFDVLTARDAQEALGQLGAQRVAGVIADHMLPGMSGIELLDGALVMQPQAARVLITASDRINVLRDAINEARVHRFLSKPLRLHELPTLVGEAIREAARGRERTPGGRTLTEERRARPRQRAPGARGRRAHPRAPRRHR
jgi:DNA-binding NtrC family response regulator